MDNQPEVADRIIFSRHPSSEPTLLAGLLVGIRGFGPHETMSGIVVDYRLEGLARYFHLRRGVRQLRIHSRIIARGESINRSLDSGHGILVGRTAIEHKNTAKIGPIGREAERLPTAPAEACHKQGPVRRRNFLCIISNAVEIRAVT
jgi:hypothetical protein